MKPNPMSQQALSADTEVVLLLCGRFGGERQEPFQPLSTREYGEFAKWLNARALRPADLLSDSGRAHLPNVHEAKLERKRVDFLLGRGTALALALERWSRGGLWVMSRGDPEFPKRLKRHLKHTAPPLLYGAGDKALLEAGGLAVIGSRDATDSALDFTRAIASKCAKEGLGVVSGGARGVDAAAMQGATEAGGVSIGVLASDLLKTSVNRQNRIGLQEGRLALISPFYPEAGFNAGNAMARNKFIYTLADQALVIDSALGSGGTWEGALEDLQHRWVPLYVRAPGNGPGNAALIEKGGIAFTFAMDASETLADFFARATSSEKDTATDATALQQSLLVSGDADRVAPVPTTVTRLEAREEPPHELPLPAPVATAVTTRPNAEAPSASKPSPSMVVERSTAEALDMYADFLSKLTLVLTDGPRSEDEVAELLCIEKSQTKAWLKRATEIGSIEKLKKPLRYALRQQPSLC